MKQLQKSLFDFDQTGAVCEEVEQYLSVPEFTLSLNFKKHSRSKFCIHCSQDIEKICRNILQDDINWREHFIMLTLSTKHNVINFCRLSIGAIDKTLCDTRVVLQFALACNATSIILCHNHPSGSVQPSRQDEALTTRIKSACSFFDINVLDHIVIGETGYYSFMDEGLL